MDRRLASGMAQRHEEIERSKPELSGDLEVIQRLTRLLRELDIDWEEQLARWVGDSAAHGAGLVLNQLRDCSRRTSQVFWLNVSEYLTEEANMVPYPDEVTAYLEAVDGVRDDVERLGERIARLGGGVQTA